jgi:hypothetical protein
VNIYELASDPEIAKLIGVLYEGYQMSYDELLKEMNVKPQKLNEILEASEGLWDTPEQYSYKLTERGEVAYGIIKSRNIRVKGKKEKIEKEISERPAEKLKVRILPAKRFLETWKSVIRAPSKFFDNMPKSGGYIEPLKFVLVCYIPLAISAPILDIFHTGISALLLPPLAILAGIIFVFIQSIIVHAGVRIFANYSNKGFESTLRVMSYSSAVVVVSWIPFIGFIPVLYGIYIAIKGLIKVNKTTRLRAFFAYFGIITFIGIVASAVAIYLIYSGMVESSVQLPEIPEI